MIESFNSQFIKPHGILGWMVGWIMVFETRERNRWAVSTLDLKPNDSILEIGFGPGVALQQVAKVAHFVAGIDHSAVMVRQASQRNAVAISEGKMALRQGTAQQLPYESATFDRVFAINSLHLWPDKRVGLMEVRRVLKPGGTLAIFEQPYQGDSQEAAHQTQTLLVDTGFSHVRVVEKMMKPNATIGVLGIN